MALATFFYALIVALHTLLLFLQRVKLAETSRQKLAKDLWRLSYMAFECLSGGVHSPTWPWSFNGVGWIIDDPFVVVSAYRPSNHGTCSGCALRLFLTVESDNSSMQWGIVFDGAMPIPYSKHIHTMIKGKTSTGSIALRLLRLSLAWYIQCIRCQVHNLCHINRAPIHYPWEQHCILVVYFSCCRRWWSDNIFEK